MTMATQLDNKQLDQFVERLNQQGDVDEASLHRLADEFGIPAADITPVQGKGDYAYQIGDTVLVRKGNSWTTAE